MAFFNNLRDLVSDMKEHCWVIDLFEFKFNNINYFVFVRLYLDGENKPKYSLAKIIFMDREDRDRTLMLHANSSDFLSEYFNVKEFREYFRIPYVEGGVGDAIRNFKEIFGNVIPQMVRNKSQEQKIEIANYIDSEKKRNQGIFLSHVIRLNGRYRSGFTDNKARLLRPDVYRHFADDPTITFAFFVDQEHEHSEEEILELFRR